MLNLESMDWTLDCWERLIERDFASLDLKVWWLEKASFIKWRAADDSLMILSIRCGPLV